MPENKRLRGRPRAFYAKPEFSKIKAIDRGLDILECIAENRGMTLTEIAENLNQSPATIYRVLCTYESRKIVEMDPVNQTWFMGSASFRLGSAYLKRSGIIERARPIMRKLMEQTGETTNLGIEVSNEVMFISQVETHENIRAFFPPGARAPMHSSGIGKALLAHSHPNRIKEYLKQKKLASFTEYTIFEPDQLRAELIKVREQGFAFDNEEKNIGMRCVAAPIFNHFNEVIAGLSVSGPSIRLSLDRIDRVSKMVSQSANLLSW